jgi:tetratricopeptide (TPR) repeat protein
MLSLKRCLSIKPDYDEALTKLREFNTNLMASYPDDVQPYIDLGDGLRIAGKYEEAIPYLEQARTKAPDNTQVDYLLGQCYSHIGQYDKAVELLTVALAAKPDDYGALLEIAKTYEAMGDAEKAKTSYLALARLKPKDWATYQAIGDYYLRAGNVSAALTNYEKGLSFDPSDYSFWAGTALIYARENKKLERAKKLADRSLVLKADNPLGTKALGYISYRMKSYSEATKYLTAAKTSLPDDAEITELLAAIAEKGDEPQKKPPTGSKNR